MRISKRDYYYMGGAGNPRLYRRQVRGVWHYFQVVG